MASVLKLGLAVLLVSVLGMHGALATGNAGAGQGLFVRCAVCHTAQSGAANRIGPNLFGVVGRNAGTLAGYNYSRAMTKSGLTWDEPTLAHYLMGPSALVPGTKMAFAGFSNPQQANDVAAYLATLK